MNLKNKFILIMFLFVFFINCTSYSFAEGTYPRGLESRTTPPSTLRNGTTADPLSVAVVGDG